MAATKSRIDKVIAGLPKWVSSVVEHDESLRFEALALLEQAKPSLAEIESKPPADPAAAASASRSTTYC